MYLNCHTYYSLRYGTLSVEKLVSTAKQMGIDTLVLTDINNSTAVTDFVREAKAAGINPIAGIDFRDGDRQLYTGIAKNNEGFRELNECLTAHHLSKSDYPDQAWEFENAYVVYPLGAKAPEELSENEFTGIRPDQVRRLFTSEYRKYKDKLLVWQPVTYANRNDYYLHKNLRAVHHNTLLSKLKAENCAGPGETLKLTDNVLKHYAEHPKIVNNTEKILSDCSIDFEYKSPKNRKRYTVSRYDDKILLEKLAMDGLRYRYKKDDKKAAQRVRHELEIIDKLGFSAYFLMAWDIVRYSMSRGFYHVGRGSGANSVVAFCLKITDVDPIELDLYFERFLNPKRTSPPDFDIDYSWKDRDEVQEYIFKRYGRKYTALLGTISTFKGKSIYRELGKVHGLPKEEIDSLIDEPESKNNQNEITDRIHRLATMMEGFPNLRSVHAGGVIVSEEPLSCYTALDLPPKGLPTTQWDMYVAEDIGFEKLDILSQRGIGHILEAAEIVRENRGIDIDVHKVEKFKNDSYVKQQLRDGETNGCFYVESPAMRGLLKKLRCDNYISLVAASSIIRPGVAKSGMMKEYIHRFHNPDKFEYLHPIMEEQLGETFGVMVYQEDVLKICHHFAGLDLADADILRRAMTGKFKRKDQFNKIVGKFFDNCRQRGYPDQVAQEVWRQIASFAGYAFSKAHSASYAVESFQSLYLKAHYPLEFMVAVINNFGGFFRSWVYFNEARRWGANILLPCVNFGRYKTSIIGRDIYVGFIHVENLEHKFALRIVELREERGEYAGLEDFIMRTGAGLEQTIILIRCGAFRFTNKSKAELLWNVHMLLSKKDRKESSPALFAAEGKEYKLPEFEHSHVEDAYDELELIGFPISMTYFDLLKTSFRGEVKAGKLMNYVGHSVRLVGTMVTIKYVRTVRKEIMYFGAFIDSEGEFFDTVHFPLSLKRYPFKGSGVYLILGKVTEEFGHPAVEVHKMAKLPLKPDPRE